MVRNDGFPEVVAHMIQQDTAWPALSIPSDSFRADCLSPKLNIHGGIVLRKPMRTGMPGGRKATTRSAVLTAKKSCLCRKEGKAEFVGQKI